MDPDPRSQNQVLGYPGIRLGQSLLHGHGTLNGINHAREFGQDAVARCIRDPAPVLGDEVIHDLAMSRQGAQGPDLVLAHEAGITCHVGGEDRCQPALNSFCTAGHGTT